MIYFLGLSRVSFRTLTLIATVSFAGCGGGGSPTGPSPGPSETPGTPVSAFVFYDENANGIADPLEQVRFPAITVTVGSRTGQTATGGQAVVANVPAGTQTAAARADTLPAYFQPGLPTSVPVPQAAGTQAAVPLTLAIGSNRPNVYMGFGDSITAGEGSNDGTGYLSYLEADLRNYWGKASVANEGQSATRSNRGAQRIGQSLSKVRPAYTLILYGTNDWNDLACKDTNPDCYTIDSLRSIIHDVRAFSSNPVLATIIPVNNDTGFVDRDPNGRNETVRKMNELIRTLARTERVALADQYAVFMRQPALGPIYTDYLHPNERGYQLMAQEWFRAITQPVSTTLAARYDRPLIFFRR
jgi:lysophospholipase L1-like esterase